MRVLLSILLIVFPLAATQATVAQASDQWCDTDPILLIQTPAGRLVPVYVDVGAQNILFSPNTLMGSLNIRYTAVPTSDRKGTQVRVVLTVPPTLGDHSFAIREIVSTEAFGTGAVYARASGVSGRPSTSTFQLPYP